MSSALAREGCALALADINDGALNETADDVRQYSSKVPTHLIDVSNKSQMQHSPEAVIKAHGHIRVLINNAGVSVSHTVEAMTLDDFEWIMGINFWG